MSRKEKVKKYAKAVSYVIIGIVAVLFLWFILKHGQELLRIARSGDVAREFSEFIRSFGFIGAVILTLFQTLQIALAFIPGEPIELAAGMLYGGFWGAVCCQVGVLLGTMIVYYLVAKFGSGIIEAFHDTKKIGQYRVFRDSKNAEVLTFILFLVPAMPKDFLSFLAPLTPMKPWRFFLISTLARAPGMFITTYAGSQILTGNWGIMALLYGILAVGALVGSIYYYFLSKKEREAERNASAAQTDELGKE